MTLRRSMPFLARKKGESGTSFILPNTGDLLRVFSLRKYDGYNGNCLRVIRASDSATLEVGFVDGVVDIAAIIVFCAGTTGKIDRWYDQSGSGTFAFQATDALRPFIYESGAIVTEGGLPSIRWPSASSLSIGSSLSVKSAFIVYKISAIQGLNTLLIGSASSQLWGGGTAIGGVNGVTVWTGTVRVSNTSENTNYNLSSFFADPDNKVSTNGADEATAGTAISSLSVTGLSRGDGNFSINGKKHEVILYGASQYSEKATIENMINSYYSIY